MPGRKGEIITFTALTVVLLATVVGVVMVIALLALPAAMAGHFTKRLWHMMSLATLCCILLTTGGLALSYTPGLPAGATIIALAGGVYLVVILGRRLCRKRSRGTRKSAARPASPTA